MLDLNYPSFYPMLIAATASYGRKEFAILGRLLLTKKPEIANELISTYLPAKEAIETDQSKIGYFFLVFCKVQDIDLNEYLGPVYKSNKVAVRRLFIACILNLYAPHVFIHPLQNTSINRGLIKQLANTLQWDKQPVSVMVRQIVLWQNQYKDFSDQVSEVLEKMIESQNE